MKISILTLFPEMFIGPFDYSILKRAKEKKLVKIEYINIRDFGEGKHNMVDDTAYGGGVGMVMKVDVVHRAILHAKNKTPNVTDKTRIILLSASGKPFTQQRAQTFSSLNHLILICGHYEGIDDRVKHFIDEEISIGDFVLTGGEIPAMAMTDAIIRLIPGVLPTGATENESFSLEEEQNSSPLLEYPQYTKPRTYENLSVPEILLSGDHQKIAIWRQEQAKQKTNKVRPDLVKK
jgi:tRNA (guanine37-N1)-methyltransferase